MVLSSASCTRCSSFSVQTPDSSRKNSSLCPKGETVSQLGQPESMGNDTLRCSGKFSMSRHVRDTGSRPLPGYPAQVNKSGPILSWQRNNYLGHRILGSHPCGCPTNKRSQRPASDSQVVRPSFALHSFLLGKVFYSSQVLSSPVISKIFQTYHPRNIRTNSLDAKESQTQASSSTG